MTQLGARTAEHMAISEQVRRGLIETDLIFGVLDGKLSEPERASALWLFRAYNFTFPAGTSTELVRRVKAVCPLIDQQAEEIEVPVAAPAPSPIPPEQAFGWQPPEE